MAPHVGKELCDSRKYVSHTGGLGIETSSSLELHGDKVGNNRGEESRVVTETDKL